MGGRGWLETQNIVIWRGVKLLKKPHTIFERSHNELSGGRILLRAVQVPFHTADLVGHVDKSSINDTANAGSILGQLTSNYNFKIKNTAFLFDIRYFIACYSHLEH